MKDTPKIRWRTLHRLLEHDREDGKILDGFTLLYELRTKKWKGIVRLIHEATGVVYDARYARDETIEYNLWPEDFVFQEDSDDDECCDHPDGWIALTNT